MDDFFPLLGESLSSQLIIQLGSNPEKLILVVAPELIIVWLDFERQIIFGASSLSGFCHKNLGLGNFFLSPWMLFKLLLSQTIAKLKGYKSQKKKRTFLLWPGFEPDSFKTETHCRSPCFANLLTFSFGVLKISFISISYYLALLFAFSFAFSFTFSFAFSFSLSCFLRCSTRMETEQ